VNGLHGGLSIAIKADRSIAGEQILIGNVPAQRLIVFRTQDELASFAAGMKPFESECTATSVRIGLPPKPTPESWATPEISQIRHPGVPAIGAQDRNHPALAIGAPADSSGR
jgi:hypothetical protein